MATGGEATSTNPDTKLEKLTCTICLELFRSPRLLPCHHTFCLECLEDLADKHNHRAFPCPTCRRTTKVPAGGVSQFQVNFYLEDDTEEARRKAGKSDKHGKRSAKHRNPPAAAAAAPKLDLIQLLKDDDGDTLDAALHAGLHLDEDGDPTNMCKTHPDEKLRFVCLACDGQMICRDCKLTRHEGHKTDDLMQEAKEAVNKLEDIKKHLKKQVKLAKTNSRLAKKNLKSAEKRQRAIISMIKARASSLRRLVSKCKEEVISKLEEQFEEDANETGRCLDIVQKLYAMVDEEFDLHDPDTNLALLLNTCRVLEGHEADVESLVNSTKTDLCTVPYFLSRDDEIVHGKVTSFLCSDFLSAEFAAGKAVFETELQFQAFEDASMVIFSLCPLSDGAIWAAFGPSESGSPGQLVLFDSGEEERREEATGKICLTRVGEDRVRVIGRDFPVKVLDSEQTFNAELKVDRKILGSVAQDVLSTRKLGYAVYQEASGCILVSEKVLDLASDPLTFERSLLVSLSRKVVAFDANSLGILFAVVHEDDPHVYLYGYSSQDPVAKYDTDHEGRCPRAVCFCQVGGQEMVAVADWGCSVVYLLSTEDDGLRFEGLVGRDCPELLRPTALAVDDDGVLWIGCQGGRVFCARPESGHESSKDDDDDDNAGDDDDSDNCDDDDDDDEGEDAIDDDSEDDDDDDNSDDDVDDDRDDHDVIRSLSPLLVW